MHSEGGTLKEDNCRRGPERGEVMVECIVLGMGGNVDQEWVGYAPGVQWARARELGVVEVA